MYSILADLITALAGAAFLVGSIWLATAMLDDEPVPTGAAVITITAAVIGTVAGKIAADLRASHRREQR
jgi:hypothetical protein